MSAPQPFAAPAAVLAPIVSALLITATACIAGRTLTRAVPAQGALEIAAVSLAAGLLALAQVGLALGGLGQLRLGPMLAVFGALHLLGHRAWREAVAALRAARRAPVGAGLALLFAVAIVPAALLALEPPLGFDATMYHLPFAKAFAATGHLPFLPALRFPVFPQLNEMLFALALLLDGDGAAQLLMVVSTALTAALLVAWGRAARDGGGGGGAAGWLAAAAWLGNPLVVYLAGSAYVDAALALWVTAALYCLHRSRQGAGAGWIVLAGAFAGGAAAGKYLGLFFVAAIGAIVAWRDRRGALWFAAAAAAVMAPWYCRIFFYTHNPVFPYFPQWFGSSPWDPLLFRPVLSRATLSRGVWLPALGSRLLALVRLPWDLSVGWRAAGAVAPLSAVYLAALPLAAAASRRDVQVRRLLALAALFALATLFLPREPRYVVAALPLASLAGGFAVARLRWPLAAAGWQGRRWALALLCAALLLPGWLYGIDRLRRLGLPPASAAGREAFLARQLPLYPALRFLNRSRGSDYTAYGWKTENLHYFAAGLLLGDWSGPASYLRMPAVGGDPEALAQALRGVGASYLIRPAPAAPAAPAAGVGCAGSAAFRRRFALLFADDHGCVFGVAPAAAGSLVGRR